MQRGKKRLAEWKGKLYWGMHTDHAPVELQWRTNKWRPSPKEAPTEPQPDVNEMVGVTEEAKDRKRKCAEQVEQQLSEQGNEELTREDIMSICE